MSFIFTLLAVMTGLDVVWWVVSWQLVAHRGWRAAISLFMLAQMAGLISLIVGRMSRRDWDRVVPSVFWSAVYLWHFLGLALVIVCLLAEGARWLVARRAETAVAANGWTRREVIGLGLALTPAVLTSAATLVAAGQLGRFRVRNATLAVAGLPAALDGMRIAHVSDSHVGRFTSGGVLEEMVRATNELDADLVLFTGDLINDALADLEEGMRLLEGMRGRFGTYFIEGNHDLIESRARFEARARQASVPFLRDEARTVAVRGAPVQLLGLRWVYAQDEEHDAATAQAVRALAEKREANAFPILLAHHPHAFDAAAELGIPLTLAGHTHGGQLMLNERVGFGPAMFRYWSGLYEKGAAQLFVSNGVGNWFPLRTRAPAEIVHLTLRARG